MGSVSGVLSIWLLLNVKLVLRGDHFYCCAHKRVCEREYIFSSSFDPVLLVGVCGFLSVLGECVGLGYTCVLFLVFVFW